MGQTMDEFNAMSMVIEHLAARQKTARDTKELVCEAYKLAAKLRDTAYPTDTEGTKEKEYDISQLCDLLSMEINR